MSTSKVPLPRKLDAATAREVRKRLPEVMAKVEALLAETKDVVVRPKT